MHHADNVVGHDKPLSRRNQREAPRRKQGVVVERDVISGDTESARTSIAIEIFFAEGFEQARDDGPSDRRGRS